MMENKELNDEALEQVQGGLMRQPHIIKTKEVKIDINSNEHKKDEGVSKKPKNIMFL